MIKKLSDALSTTKKKKNVFSRKTSMINEYAKSQELERLKITQSPRFAVKQLPTFSFNMEFLKYRTKGPYNHLQVYQ
ncbi:hypothetical protein BpHYR1_035643 [Brachionus plicatilis]|uniref:Uncharacterized protein n=1 Tax=Brachionus plicatilis TaxID=10195 RepID=A0A3M7RPY4_BRAPC|nr:hypothetical protein BpHYR1_035643 [Brachionus plicatilis]